MNITIAWLPDDEIENINLYGVNFKLAKEIVMNNASLVIPNLHKDFCFIGFTDDLLQVLVVYCLREGHIRQIIMARKATLSEKNALFLKIAGM